MLFFFFQAEDGIRDYKVTGVQTCALPIFGRPEGVAGTVLNRMFSREAEDGVYATLLYGDGKTGQLAANWSDDSFRKMALKVTVWGANGRIYADRQEVQLHL